MSPSTAPLSCEYITCPYNSRLNTTIMGTSPPAPPAPPAPSATRRAADARPFPELSTYAATILPTSCGSLVNATATRLGRHAVARIIVSFASPGYPATLRATHASIPAPHAFAAAACTTRLFNAPSADDTSIPPFFSLGRQCTAPRYTQTRLAATAGSSHPGSEYAASINKNSPSSSHTCTATSNASDTRRSR